MCGLHHDQYKGRVRESTCHHRDFCRCRFVCTFDSISYRMCHVHTVVTMIKVFRTMNVATPWRRTDEAPMGVGIPAPLGARWKPPLQSRNLRARLGGKTKILGNYRSPRAVAFGRPMISDNRRKRTLRYKSNAGNDCFPYVASKTAKCSSAPELLVWI